MKGTPAIGLALVGLALLALLATLGYPPGRQGVPGPALFPRLVAVMLAACAIWLAWRAPASDGDVPAPPGRATAIAGTIGLLVAYVATWHLVPFVPRTALLLVGFLRLLSVGWRGTLVTAVALAVIVFVVFERLLAVRL